jgi:hypothetical protein
LKSDHKKDKGFPRNEEMSVAILVTSKEPGISKKHLQQVFQACRIAFEQVVFVSDSRVAMVDENIDWIGKVLDYKAIDPIILDLKGLVVPDGLGFYNQKLPEFKQFLEHFVQFKSKNYILIRTNINDW